MTCLWQPGPARVAGTLLTRFTEAARERAGQAFPDYAALHRWSVDDRAAFWNLVWDFCGVVAETRGERTIERDGEMPGARFFPDAKLNFAQNLLRRRDDAPALVFRNEPGHTTTWSWQRLYDEVNRVAAGLAAAGLKPGDRVGAIMPNIPEAIVAMLATTALGGIWSSCSPDFGAQGILDRFDQIAPTVLITVDGYWYAGKVNDIRGKAADIRAALPSVRAFVGVPFVGCGEVPGATPLDDFKREPAGSDIPFVSLPFNHPLYILYSSGTTGKPKCIVHGAGGTLLQHLKEHQLHADVHPGDRLFYFTTCGWMMWNWLVSGLASQATLLLYDGSPFHPDGHPLFDYAAEARCTHFGTRAFPPMAVGFWGEPDGAKYRAAYFERFPNVWAHGDFAEVTAHDGFVIYGRSDATLNPGGVRIGTAEIYRQVEKFEEVVESVAIGQDWDGDVRVVLFVVLKPGLALEESLQGRLRQQIRAGASPRHVPARIVQVTDIPRTRSGKLTELAIRDVVHGKAIKNAEALANPEALEQYRNRPELAD